MAIDDYMKEWDFAIIKWLYRLSLKYPEMNEEFKLHGFSIFQAQIVLFGDLKIGENLPTEIKSLEYMMRDKPKSFRYYGATVPSQFSKLDNPPQKLKYYFDKFRKNLRDETLDNLLDDE